MEPRFVLKNPKAEKETGIDVIVRNRNDRLKYATGLKITPDNWDKETQRPNFTNAKGKLKKDFEYVDHWINEYRTTINNTLYQWRLQKIPVSLDKLREKLDKDFRLYEPKLKETELLKYVTNHIETVKYVKDANPPRLIAERTKAKYRTIKMHLENFEATHHKRKLKLTDIDKTFYNNFTYYLQIDLNLANNTVFRILSGTAMFMRAASDQGLIKPENAKIEGIKSYMEDVFNIALTEEEFIIIRDMDLSSKTTLDMVRDYFVIGCRIAQRWGDFNDFSADNFISEGMIHIKQKKTGNSVYLPAHPDVISVMEKHNWKLPPCISNQNFDKHLKTIGKMAGIDYNVIKHRTTGGILQKQVYKKYQMISSHTARRTGATLMYKSGMSVQDNMSVTGHRSMKEFLKYIKLTDQEIAEHLSKHTYFKG